MTLNCQFTVFETQSPKAAKQIVSSSPFFSWLLASSGTTKLLNYLSPSLSRETWYLIEFLFTIDSNNVSFETYDLFLLEFGQIRAGIATLFLMRFSKFLTPCLLHKIANKRIWLLFTVLSDTIVLVNITSKTLSKYLKTASMLTLVKERM